MAFVSREQWGASPTRGAGNALGHPDGTTVHWEGPGMGSRPHSECAALVRSIQRFHQVTRGWADVAYNLTVCEHGDVFEGRGAHRGNAANGSTASNLARFSVCALVGEGDPVTDALKAGIRDAIDYLRREGGAGSVVDCHSDHFATSCPGPALRAWVKSGAGRPSAQAPSKPASSIPNLPKPAPRPAPKPAATKGLNVKLIDLRNANRVLVKGPGVKPLQRLLGVTADGLGGTNTRNALLAAQRRAGLTADAIFGPATAEALLAGK